MTKKSKRDMAYELDIDVSTLYNWRKYKPNLYQIKQKFILIQKKPCLLIVEGLMKVMNFLKM